MGVGSEERVHKSSLRMRKARIVHGTKGAGVGFMGGL